VIVAFISEVPASEKQVYLSANDFSVERHEYVDKLRFLMPFIDLRELCLAISSEIKKRNNIQNPV
jgi:hypothetical protein